MILYCFTILIGREEKTKGLREEEEVEGEGEAEKEETGRSEAEQGGDTDKYVISFLSLLRLV